MNRRGNHQKPRTNQSHGFIQPSFWADFLPLFKACAILRFLVLATISGQMTSQPVRIKGPSGGEVERTHLLSGSQIPGPAGAESEMFLRREDPRRSFSSPSAPSVRATPAGRSICQSVRTLSSPGRWFRRRKVSNARRQGSVLVRSEAFSRGEAAATSTLTEIVSKARHVTYPIMLRWTTN